MSLKKIVSGACARVRGSGSTDYGRRQELAEQVDVELGLIDAIEHGIAEVPAALYPDFAAVFGITARDFAKTCLMYENPSAYEALFGALPQELREAA